MEGTEINNDIRPFFNYEMKNFMKWALPATKLQEGECGSSCTHVKCQKFDGTILQPVCKLVSFSLLTLGTTAKMH